MALSNAVRTLLQKVIIVDIIVERQTAQDAKRTDDGQPKILLIPGCLCIPVQGCFGAAVGTQALHQSTDSVSAFAGDHALQFGIIENGLAAQRENSRTKLVSGRSDIKCPRRWKPAANLHKCLTNGGGRRQTPSACPSVHAISFGNRW